MDFAKIKSVKDYIREQEEEEAKKAQDELDQKVEALFLTGEPVNDETLQVFADENEMELEDLKAKVYGMVTTLLTDRDAENEEDVDTESPVDEEVVTEAEDSEEPKEETEDDNSDEESEDDSEEPSTEEEPSEEIPQEEEEETSPADEFDIGDKVSFEVENEEHPLADADLEVIDKDGDFIQCLAKNPDTGVQVTYWFKADEIKKIPNETEVNPTGEEVSDVETPNTMEDDYEEIKKESITDILRRNLSLIRG